MRGCGRADKWMGGVQTTDIGGMDPGARLRDGPVSCDSVKDDGAGHTLSLKVPTLH